jgi:ankyrin repeat protein
MAVVRELIADAGRRSCIKAMAKDGATVLHAAAAAGQAAMVQLLLDAGARPDARDRVSRGPAQARLRAWMLMASSENVGTA